MSLLQTTDISTINAYTVGKLRLRNSSRYPQPLYTLSHQASHVLRHAFKATRCCNLMRRIIMHMYCPFDIRKGSQPT